MSHIMAALMDKMKEFYVLPMALYVAHQKKELTVLCSLVGLIVIISWELETGLPLIAIQIRNSSVHICADGKALNSLVGLYIGSNVGSLLCLSQKKSD